MWHVLKALMQNLTAIKIVIQNLTRCNCFNSKSDWKMKTLVTVVLFKNSSKMTNFSIFPGEYVSKCESFQSNIFSQIDSLSKEIYIKVWHIVKNSIQNPWVFRNCFFWNWHFENYLIQNLTRSKFQLKNWFSENFQSEKCILEMQAECKNWRLYKGKNIQVFFYIPCLFCKNWLFLKKIKFQTLPRSK